MNQANRMWDEFAKKVYPHVSPHSVQYRETKRTFFAGMYSSVLQLCSVAKADEARSLTMLEDFMAELKFELELMKGN